MTSAYQFSEGYRLTHEDNRHDNLIFNLPNGDRYEGITILILGDIQGKVKHGFGVYRYSNGDLYEGNWVDDEQNGRDLVKTKVKANISLVMAACTLVTSEMANPMAKAHLTTTFLNLMTLSITRDNGKTECPTGQDRLFIITVTFTKGIF
jgi:hypothetical protein